MSSPILLLMNDTARSYQTPDAATTDGMDHIFEQKIQGDQPLIRIDPDRVGVTLEDAAKALNLHVDTVRRYLKTGKLSGFKAKDKFGNKWFVDKKEISHEIQADQTLSTHSIQIDPALSNPKIQADQPVSTPSIQIDQSLVDVEVCVENQKGEIESKTESITLLAITETQLRVIENQSNQLKAAGDVIMYLRSQLEDKENTIKLLTDSQHKSSWWSKFSSWFKPSS